MPVSDIINKILGPKLFGIPLIVYIIVIIIIAIFLIKRRPKEKELKPIDLDVKKMTRKDFDKYVKLMGWKRLYWKNLRVGINPIGHILKYSYEEHKFKIKDKDEYVYIPLYFIKTSRFGIIGLILSIFGINDRFVINGNLIENFNNPSLYDQHDLILNIGSVFRAYNDIYFTDDSTRTIIHDLALNMVLEAQTKKLVEFTPLMTLLEIEQAKVKFKSELFTKLEKERFRQDVEQYSRQAK